MRQQMNGLYWSAILLLMAAYVAGYGWSTSHTDTADELMRAFEIRHGLDYPLEGPPLGQVLHLGPAWFYLTAVPLWIRESWLCAALFIGSVCSLKFPLAYYCGRKLVDAEFGLLWAAALFVPGWTSFEPLVFLNPNAVAAVTLGLLALALWGRERTGGPLFALFGLLMGLAVHVHPTSAPAFVLAVWLLWLHHRRGEPIVGPAVALLMGFVVPFLPYIASQVAHGWPDWNDASGYVVREVSLLNIVNAPAVIAHALYTGPEYLMQQVAGWPAERATWVAIGMVVLAGTGIVAAGVPRMRRLLLAFLLALLLFAGAIACLRITTPIQFAWVLGPVLAGITALGLRAVASYGPLRPVAITALLAAVFLNVLVTRALAFMVRDGEGSLTSRVLDIKGGIEPVTYRDIWFPAWRREEMGAFLCRTPKPASLHGHLAFTVDKDLGLDALFACGERDGIALVGADAASHPFAMTRPYWRALGWQPDCWIGSLGFAEVEPRSPAAPLSLALGDTYLPRRAGQGLAQRVTLSIEGSATAAMMVTNVVGPYEHFSVVGVEANGVAMAPAAGNNLSALYRAPAESGDAVSWTITVMTTNRAALDVVTLEDPAARPAAPSPAPTRGHRSPACGTSP